MVTRKLIGDKRKSDDTPVRNAKPAKVNFRVSGEEMIEKQVKLSGSTGRVYVPLDWVGKHVKIIRID